MRYTPFDKDLDELKPDDLVELRKVHEGWYVEYKSELITPRKIAKSLSSFANQLGGWVFFGVSEDRNEHVAQSFPGIPNSEVPDSLESIKNASKDLINPNVFFNTKVFKGPVESIGLREERSILVVQVPPGADCPYLHNDGRVYIRVADSSDPRPETDRSVIGLLVERGNQAKSRLAKRIVRSPVVSKGEEKQCYIHVSIMSDPFETLGHCFPSAFSEFSELMRNGALPFDNIYSKSGGYVARQTVGNNPYNRVFTWEFSTSCHSFITYPIPPFQSKITRAELPSGSIIDSFVTQLEKDSDHSNFRIIDLNQVLVVLTGIILRHRRLANLAKVKGPFYVKVHLENIWRTIPYVDSTSYMNHYSEFGLPVVQEHNVLVPSGTTLNSFVKLQERNALDSEIWSYSEDISDYVLDSYEVSRFIFEAFGIPLKTIGPETIADLFTRYYKQTER